MQASRSSAVFYIAALAIGLSGTALVAQPHGWGRSDSGQSDWRGGRSEQNSSREGRVEVSRFRIEGDAALALAHGPISIVPFGEDAENEAGSKADPRFAATFEAAVEDQLVRSGYDVARITPHGGQVAEVRVIRSEAAPADAPHKPVSGAMSVGVSNYGTSLGMALQIDGSKPRGALVATRLEARIRDRASGQVLWEGHAETSTRVGDGKWNDQKVADKLARALFDGFPARTGEQRLVR